MRCFEILIATSAISTNGGPFVPDNDFMIDIPDEAERLLETILIPYGRRSIWSLSNIGGSLLQTPWALACLDREYPIAGHIGTARGADFRIKFAPYDQPVPLPDSFVPGVGVLVFGSKMELERVATRSPVFEAAWEAFKDCSPSKSWLAFLDPLPEDWLALVVPGDGELWLVSRRK
jgi:hypothetical protein